MADGRWVMTENELNNVVSGFAGEGRVLPNEGKSIAVDVRDIAKRSCPDISIDNQAVSKNNELGKECAFCGSQKLRAGFGKYGDGFGCHSSKCEDCGGITDFVYKDEVGKFFE